MRLGSSLRCRRPEQTLRDAQALTQRLGISRVADITRMDRLGLPVFASVRPRGQVLRVHAGKGLEPLDARVGALMEAIEYAVAEPGCTRWTAVPMAIGRFLAQFQGRLDLLDFAPILGRPITLDDVLPTVACERLADEAVVHLPAELVFVPFEPGTQSPFFGWSSNGLASGNSVEEATLHGLLEVVERDVLSLDRALDRSCWIEPHELPAPFDSLVAEWRRSGVETAVRGHPNEFGIPCVEVCLHEPGASVYLAAGSGAHLDARIALSRALCEAAQSRLSHVHGARDDVVNFFGRYHQLETAQRTDAERAPLARLFDRSRRMRFAELGGEDEAAAGDDPGSALATTLEKLEAAGFETVLRYRFAAELGDLHVVKVVVPRCEDVENSPGRMGRRLFTQVTRQSPA